MSIVDLTSEDPAFKEREDRKIFSNTMMRMNIQKEYRTVDVSCHTIIINNITIMSIDPRQE